MRNPYIKRLTFVVLLFTFFIPLIPGYAASPQQESSPEGRAQDTLNRLTPEERVGQLFLVTFQGTDASPGTQIHDLITNHYLGGVILSAENDNFTLDETVTHAWILNNQLQTSRFSSTQFDHIETLMGELFRPTYVPLFIGISQEGDGAPQDQIHTGLTQLPSQLSIGATWNPELARQVGAVAGQELASIGINLLFGPSLDVSDVPNAEGEGDLNVRVFGGDPYWVGEMARAYIAGVHEGADGRIALVGTHFPGLGSADRLPENEIATVRKSLEQLQQIELAPFFTVTSGSTEPNERVDALLVSHIRYQGLQGNIRSTTRPVSFDQSALTLLMDLAPFSGWREDGGLMISDDLGSRAVRRFYDPTEQTFNARRLALDAFLAGNDMLYLNNFVSDTDPDAYTTIINTLDFFAQKYREDPVFAQKVDESVLRILTLKFQLYGFFTLNLVLPTGNPSEAGSAEANQISYEVAQRSATLISPPLSELDNVLPNSPNFNERIVFITDTYTSQQCSTCPTESVLAPDALEQAIVARYGLGGETLINQANLVSYTTEQLISMLDGGEDAQAVEYSIQRARWLIFTILNADMDRSSSSALQRFLAERPDLGRDKHIVVFAANAPYYLDATDISKLTAYFGLFGKTSPFIDVAARLLFKEIPAPAGSLPISVPGIGYELIEATSPTADQIFPLVLDLPNHSGDSPVNQVTPEATYNIGDSIPLMAGVILDYNHHPVPDHTPVQFVVTINGQEAPAISATTLGGMATAGYKFDQPGIVSIQAISGAAHSNELIFEIPQNNGDLPTSTPPPTETPVPSPTVTEPPPTPIPTPASPPDAPSTGLRDWFLGILIIAVVAWSASRTGALMGHVRAGIRWGFSAIITGLLTYTYGSLSLPGSAWVMDTNQHWGLLLLAFIGALFGWGATAAIFPPKQK